MPFPNWLSKDTHGAFVVDADKAYPVILSAMGASVGNPDQYQLECAYQCAKLKIQDLITGTADDPRPANPLVIVVDCTNKIMWKHSSHAVGKGKTAATEGGEARQVYANIKHLF